MEAQHGQRRPRARIGFAAVAAGNVRSMAKGDVHVVPSESGWRVEIAADGRARSVHRTQAAAREAGVNFTMKDIDRLSRRVPCLCKVAPAVADVHIEDVHRAGGIMGILGELERAGLLHREVPTVHSATLGEALERLVLLVRGVLKGESAATLARELGMSRTTITELRHLIQANAAQLQSETALNDNVVEADELFQNAGEKRR